MWGTGESEYEQKEIDFNKSSQRLVVDILVLTNWGTNL